MINQRLTSLGSIVLALGLTTITVQAQAGISPNKVQFVSAVSKRCKHLGSVRYSFDPRKIFERKSGQPRSMHMWLKNGREVFTYRMKTLAAAKGANRLVIKDIGHDMVMYTRRGFTSYVIKKTYLRARAFRCAR